MCVLDGQGESDARASALGHGKGTAGAHCLNMPSKRQRRQVASRPWGFILTSIARMVGCAIPTGMTVRSATPRHGPSAIATGMRATPVTRASSGAQVAHIITMGSNRGPSRVGSCAHCTHHAVVMHPEAAVDVRSMTSRRRALAVHADVVIGRADDAALRSLADARQVGVEAAIRTMIDAGRQEPECLTAAWTSDVHIDVRARRMVGTRCRMGRVHGFPYSAPRINKRQRKACTPRRQRGPSVSSAQRSRPLWPVCPFCSDPTPPGVVNAVPSNGPNWPGVVALFAVDIFVELTRTKRLLEKPMGDASLDRRIPEEEKRDGAVGCRTSQKKRRDNKGSNRHKRACAPSRDTAKTTRLAVLGGPTTKPPDLRHSLSVPTTTSLPWTTATTTATTTAAHARFRQKPARPTIALCAATARVRFATCVRARPTGSGGVAHAA